MSHPGSVNTNRSMVGRAPGTQKKSATDRQTSPWSVTVTSDNVERAQTEPMPPQATPLLTNMGLVTSERFRPISVSIRRINLFRTGATTTFDPGRGSW